MSLLVFLSPIHLILKLETPAALSGAVNWQDQSLPGPVSFLFYDIPHCFIEILLTFTLLTIEILSMALALSSTGKRLLVLGNTSTVALTPYFTGSKMGLLTSANTYVEYIFGKCNRSPCRVFPSVRICYIPVVLSWLLMSPERVSMSGF